MHGKILFLNAANVLARRIGDRPATHIATNATALYWMLNHSCESIRWCTTITNDLSCLENKPNNREIIQNYLITYFIWFK